MCVAENVPPVLHLILSVIIRAISSQQKINVELLTKFCTDESVCIATNWPWVVVSHTLHVLIHHAPELVARNSGFGLGDLSEEGLEATNKLIRKFAVSRARQTDPLLQLTDVMNRLLELSQLLL